MATKKLTKTGKVAKKYRRPKVGSKALPTNMLGYVPGMYRGEITLTGKDYAFLRRAEERAKLARRMRMQAKEENPQRSGSRIPTPSPSQRSTSRSRSSLNQLNPSRVGTPMSQLANVANAANAARGTPSRSRSPMNRLANAALSGMPTMPAAPSPAQQQAAPALVVEATPVNMSEYNSSLAKLVDMPAKKAPTKLRKDLVFLEAKTTQGKLIGQMIISHGLPTQKSKNEKTKRTYGEFTNASKILGLNADRYRAAISNELFANVANKPANFTVGKTTYVIAVGFDPTLSPADKKLVFGVLISTAQEEAREKGNPYLAVFKSVDGNAATAAVNLANKISNGQSGVLLRVA